MRAYYSDHFELPLPPGHRFPIDKYRLLREAVVELAPSIGIQLVASPAARIDQLARVHTPEHLRKLQCGDLTDREQRRIGFPWSPKMLARCMHSAGGTIAAAHQAVVDGISGHLAGGTHHAFADAGQGFCVFNDVAVAARDLITAGSIERAIVIDCDVHQGNGTASIFVDDPSVFTFSMHGDRNFPFRKSAGDLDVALADGTNDDQYLAALRRVLRDQLPWSESDFVFYLAGADAFEGDRLGRLCLTKDGLAERDQTVIDACREYGVSVAVVMAGGYAENVNDIVEIHARTLRIAASATSTG